MSLCRAGSRSCLCTCVGVSHQSLCLCSGARRGEDPSWFGESRPPTPLRVLLRQVLVDLSSASCKAWWQLLCFHSSFSFFLQLQTHPDPHPLSCDVRCLFACVKWCFSLPVESNMSPTSHWPERIALSFCDCVQLCVALKLVAATSSWSWNTFERNLSVKQVHKQANRG